MSLKQDEIEDELQPSKEAAKYNQMISVKSTLSSNHTSLRAFTYYVEALILKNAEKHKNLFRYALLFSSNRLKDKKCRIAFLKHLIFGENEPTINLHGEAMKRLMRLLCEFVVNCKGMGVCSDAIKDENQKSISPSTMNGYLNGLQRVMRGDIGVTGFEVFKIPALMTVIDNRFSKLQSKGQTTESHNTQTLLDIRVIFEYLNSISDTPRGYLCRVVFAVRIV